MVGIWSRYLVREKAIEFCVLVVVWPVVVKKKEDRKIDARTRAI
jgi:hypothetical protein